MIELSGGTLNINSSSIVEGSSLALTHLVGLPVALAILGKSVIKDYQVVFEPEVSGLAVSPEGVPSGPTTDQTTNPFDGPDEEGLFPGQYRGPVPTAGHAGPGDDVQLLDEQLDCKT
jgi:hypothetical protein